MVAAFQQVQRRHPELRAEAGISLQELAAANLQQRPVCLTSPRPELMAPYALQRLGDLACLQ